MYVSERVYDAPKAGTTSAAKTSAVAHVGSMVVVKG